jgi:bifunctional oligoribonuclease and PAP phosphatase NrnA
MPIDWSPFVELVRRHQRFLLTTHVRPDGDGLGSVLALAETLRAMGKQTDQVVASAIPSRYDFLDPDRLVTRFHSPGDEYRSAELVIVLDTGTWNQLGDFGEFLRSVPTPRLVIDHHLTQDDLGGPQLVDTSAEATGRLAFEAIAALRRPLTPTSAHCLFVALATDTGWFRHSNTTPATFTLAAELTARGAQPTAAYSALYEQSSEGRLLLLGRVLSRLHRCLNDRVCYTTVRRSDYIETGASPQESEDVVNYTVSIPGVEVGVLFLEQPAGRVKVSLRSRGSVDVARIAEQFGGGGHRAAAGATLDDPLEAAHNRLLAAVAAALVETSR